MSKPGFEPGPAWKRSTRLDSSAGPLAEPPPQHRAAGFRWEYQWEDSVNGLSPPTVDPPLPARILAELERVANSATRTVFICIRGELGIGKSTLAEIIQRALQEAAAATTSSDVRNALLTTAVLEAGDLESVTEFAGRIEATAAQSTNLVALGRPGAINGLEQWIDYKPDAAVVMRPFQPGRPLFHECLEHVAEAVGLTDATRRDRLRALASRLPDFLQTPFYFQELAHVIGISEGSGVDGQDSPLELFRTSLERRVGRQGVFDELVDCALERRLPDETTPVSGIVDSAGFHHDGYRNVILAIAVISGQEAFTTVVDAPNSLSAVRIILDHVEHRWRGQSPGDEDPLATQLHDFVVNPPGHHAVVSLQIRGLIASSYRRLGDDRLAAKLRAELMTRCATQAVSPLSPKELADLSDALSLIGDPRLQAARRARYSLDSDFFTFIDRQRVVIGSTVIPARLDDAKPVLPYIKTEVEIGPLWVANYLVTNEQFAEFWGDPDRGDYFSGTGACWFRAEAELLERVGEAFDIAATRCFWKETAEEARVAVEGTEAAYISILEVARQRALRSDRIKLWDPNQADARFSAKESPVVGINWWEADAFCAWWTDRYLGGTVSDAATRAELLTDWEWEAVRRIYYEGPHEDRLTYASDRYLAYLRSQSITRRLGMRPASVMRPIHVGLMPVPAGSGPTDMVGNVWEWTRSRVFGRIVAAEHNEGDYGFTGWTDGDAEAERMPLHADRDAPDNGDELTYRTTRGASFFSMDDQAAWHPAYRLCDPPFSSFADLGFRFAVYPRA
jgi:formylglycine-generating enzyme required for sulfatase activity